MAYREITMIEIKEVLRRWVSGIPKKRLAAQLGLDPSEGFREYAQARGFFVDATRVRRLKDKPRVEGAVRSLARLPDGD